MATEDEVVAAIPASTRVAGTKTWPSDASCTILGLAEELAEDDDGGVGAT